MQKLPTGKIILLGDPGSGKTSLIMKHIQKPFTKLLENTIGVSYYVSTMPCFNYNIRLQLWDTAGQELYRSLVPIFYRNADMAFILFDVTYQDSFDHIMQWVRELSSYDPSVMIYIIGNKIDLSTERKVTIYEAEAFADSIGARYFECTTTQKQVVDKIFLKAVNDIFEFKTPNCTSTSFHVADSSVESIDITQSPKKRIKCCRM